MNLSLENRRALVCGSTRGIGRACAHELAANGAAITLLARDQAALDEVRAALPCDHGQQHHALAADFGDWKQVRSVVAAHLQQLNAPIHILINNTGGPAGGPAIDAEPEAYLDAITKHLLCNQVLAQTLRPGMAAAKYGRIINIISTSVLLPIANLGVSNTIRGAVANWARTLAGELGKDGITVNNVLPGFTKTDRLTALFEKRAEREGKALDDVRTAAANSIPLKRLAEPEELAAVVAFLASPAGSYVNGVNLPVDGGRTAGQ